MRRAFQLGLATAFLCALPATPLSAQVDLSGEWAVRIFEDLPERLPGPDVGDYLGIPVNEAARLRADAWEASILTLPQWQCRPHPSDYVSRGPSPFRVWKEIDPATREIVAFHASWMRSLDRTIYLDGRPRPSPNAPHTWNGFSLGKWDGDTLVITTTHLKEAYLRRNGLPRSDLATVTEFWTRHDNWMTITTIVDDPVYLTEPFIRSTDFELDVRQNITAYPCHVADEIDKDPKEVPHYLPGTNPYLAEFATKHRIPAGAERGGAATMYPSFRDRMRAGGQTRARSSDAATSSSARRLAASDTTLRPIELVKVRRNIYLLAGAGGNIALSVGQDGVLMVDTGVASRASDVLAAVGRLQAELRAAIQPEPVLMGAETRSLLDAERDGSPPPKPIRYILNTSFDAEHTGGNERITASGRNYSGGNTGSDFAAFGNSAMVFAHAAVLERMSSLQKDGAPTDALPTDVYLRDQMHLSHFFNGEGVQLIHVPAAHTDGDSLIFFRGSDVIATGDVFLATSYPRIDVEAGGTINGVIDGLNRILDLALPQSRAEGGTLIVPGHGRITDSADVGYYRDMLTIIRDRVREAKKKGMSLEQIKKARLTQDYDARFGSNVAPWTTDRFVEAVYRTVGEQQ